MNLPISSREPTSPASDTRWFANEVQPHEWMLRAWLRKRFPWLADMDDVVQESYMRLIRARRSRDIGNARRYLFTTALNVVVDHFRRRRIVRFENVGDFEQLAVLEDRPSANEKLSQQEELQLLRQAMETLPTRCRQVFTLRKLYGLSHRRISTQLNISEKTVQEQVSRATRRCAAFLHRRGLP